MERSDGTMDHEGDHLGTLNYLEISSRCVCTKNFWATFWTKMKQIAGRDSFISCKIGCVDCNCCEVLRRVGDSGRTSLKGRCADTFERNLNIVEEQIVGQIRQLVKLHKPE